MIQIFANFHFFSTIADAPEYLLTTLLFAISLFGAGMAAATSSAISLILVLVT